MALAEAPMQTLRLEETKPDIAEARERWAHYWAGDVLKRPPVVAQAPKPGFKHCHGVGRYHHACHNRVEDMQASIDQWLASTDFLGDMVPSVGPDLGPDQFAAFYGAELTFSQDSPATNWVEPIVTEWEQALPLQLDRQSKAWKQAMNWSRMLHEYSQGRYVVGMSDLHSNADALLALRGAERLCMDFLDCPELIERAMQDVRAAYRPVYDALYEAGGMSSATGTVGWIPMWCEDRYAVIQCDFICMVSPDIDRRFIIPALEEEANFLDHCIYHLDGPGSLPHLDDILAIDSIDAIQWVSGAGQKDMHLWTDVLQRCVDAGKGLILYPPNLDAVKDLHRALGPKGIVYQVGGTREEIEAIMTWLGQNT